MEPFEPASLPGEEIQTIGDGSFVPLHKRLDARDKTLSQWSETSDEVDDSLLTGLTADLKRI